MTVKWKINKTNRQQQEYILWNELKSGAYNKLSNKPVQQ